MLLECRHESIDLLALRVIAACVHRHDDLTMGGGIRKKDTERKTKLSDLTWETKKRIKKGVVCSSRDLCSIHRILCCLRSFAQGCVGS